MSFRLHSPLPVALGIKRLHCRKQQQAHQQEYSQRTAITLLETAYLSCSPSRFARGKPVVGVLYRALPILQDQLLPQVCFMQTCSGRNSFVAINLHTVRPRIFPQQNDSGKNCPNSENRSLSTSSLIQTRAGGISVISCRIPFSATRNLPAKIRPCKSRPP